MYWNLVEGEYVKEVVKARGAGPDITLEQFEHLYKGDKIIYRKDKWFKSIAQGTITVKGIRLHLSSANSKRVKMFDAAGIWVDTCPVTVFPSGNNC